MWGSGRNLKLNFSGVLAELCACVCAGDVDDEYLAELESTGRGAKRTRAGRKTSLVAVAR
jgi:hypothetical protein